VLEVPAENGRSWKRDNGVAEQYERVRSMEFYRQSIHLNAVTNHLFGKVESFKPTSTILQTAFNYPSLQNPANFFPRMLLLLHHQIVMRMSESDDISIKAKEFLICTTQAAIPSLHRIDPRHAHGKEAKCHKSMIKSFTGDISHRACRLPAYFSILEVVLLSAYTPLFQRSRRRGSARNKYYNN
jgi:hypothetical protein